MRGVRYFTPNIKMHPAFGETLIAADTAGVKVVAVDCGVVPEGLEIREFVPVVLNSMEDF